MALTSLSQSWRILSFLEVGSERGEKMVSLLEKKELAKEIEDYFAGPFFVVCLLKGAFFFSADLV